VAAVCGPFINVINTIGDPATAAVNAYRQGPRSDTRDLPLTCRAAPHAEAAAPDAPDRRTPAQTAPAPRAT
jgi:hypothetical protein